MEIYVAVLLEWYIVLGLTAQAIRKYPRRILVSRTQGHSNLHRESCDSDTQLPVRATTHHSLCFSSPQHPTASELSCNQTTIRWQWILQSPYHWWHHLHLSSMWSRSDFHTAPSVPLNPPFYLRPTRYTRQCQQRQRQRQEQCSLTWDEVWDFQERFDPCARTWSPLDIEAS